MVRVTRPSERLAEMALQWHRVADRCERTLPEFPVAADVARRIAAHWDQRAAGAATTGDER